MCLSVYRLLDQIVVFEEFQMKNAILENPRVSSTILQTALNTAAIFSIIHGAEEAAV